MIINYDWVELPLDNTSSDYEYTIILDDITCLIRIYYNERSEAWLMDVKEEGSANNFIVGMRLVPNYPMFINYPSLPFNGFLLLQPIGDNVDKFRTDPYNISRWFHLFYLNNILYQGIDDD